MARVYLKDLKMELPNYRSVYKRKKNKALNSKIKYIPSHLIFGNVMYRLGIRQRYRLITNLITDIKDFNRIEFTMNNTIKLNNSTVIFEDYIDEKGLICLNAR